MAQFGVIGGRPGGTGAGGLPDAPRCDSRHGQRGPGGDDGGQAEPADSEVRPGNRDGDAPSASAGDLVRRPAQHRVLGLPVSAVLLLGGVIVALGVIGGLVIPGMRRRERARGGGAYGGGNGHTR